MGKSIKGIIIRPVRLGRSLYLPVPSQVAKVTKMTKNTKFLLTIVHDKGTFLEFNKAR